MDTRPTLTEGDYPFIDRRLPASALAWIEAPEALETLLRRQAEKTGVEIVRGSPVELRCASKEYGDATFTIYWPETEDRLHMLAPLGFQTGRA